MKNDDLQDVDLIENLWLNGRDCEVIKQKTIMSPEIDALTLSSPEITEYTTEEYKLVVDSKTGIKKLQIDGVLIHVPDKTLVELEDGILNKRPLQEKKQHFMITFMY